MTIIVKTPIACSQKELGDFCRLAQKGGEVQAEWLSELILQARMLAFLRIDGECVGVAGLKKPRPNYRCSVFANAKSKRAPEEFCYELGWVYIEPKHRGQRHSLPLVKNVLTHAADGKVYATSRKTQIPMHRSLAKCGFTREGDRWQSSRRNEEDLFLFIREAGNTAK